MFKWISKMTGSSDVAVSDIAHIRQIIAELPPHEPARCLEEIAFWLDFVQDHKDIPLPQCMRMIKLLDEAAQLPLRKLYRDYLDTSRMQRQQENKLWLSAYTYYKAAAHAHLYLIKEHQAQEEPEADGITPELPWITARAIRNLAEMKKLLYFRYMPVEERLWRQIASTYALACNLQIQARHCTLYPPRVNLSTVEQEIARALMLDVASPYNLLPAQIEIADRYCSFLAPHFQIGEGNTEAGLFCFGLMDEQPPCRWDPGTPKATEALVFGPGAAWQRLAELAEQVKTGRLQPELQLESLFSPADLLQTLQHLTIYWQREPRRRQAERAQSLSRLNVIHGLENIYAALCRPHALQAHLDEQATQSLLRDRELQDMKRYGYVTEKTQALAQELETGEAAASAGDLAESWIMENQSNGGYGAIIPRHGEEWVQVGSIVGMTMDNSEVLEIGVIRRVGRDDNLNQYVGVQVLCRGQARPVVINYCQGAAHFAHKLPALDVEAIFLPPQAERNQPGSILAPAGSIVPNIAYEMSLNGETHVFRCTQYLERAGEYDLLSWIEL